MGGVFLRRTSRPRSEVINDVSGDVATFFRVLQEHYPYFIDMLRWRLTSRAEFDRICNAQRASSTFSGSPLAARSRDAISAWIGERRGALMSPSWSRCSLISMSGSQAW
jgi:hypothetical protein